MVHVKVAIHASDRKVGAMVEALAFEIGGPKAVEGASKEFLKQCGHYVFHLPSAETAREFQEAVAQYLPDFLARVID